MKYFKTQNETVHAHIVDSIFCEDRNPLKIRTLDSNNTIVLNVKLSTYSYPKILTKLHAYGIIENAGKKYEMLSVILIGKKVFLVFNSKKTILQLLNQYWFIQHWPF